MAKTSGYKDGETTYIIVTDEDLAKIAPEEFLSSDGDKKTFTHIGLDSTLATDAYRTRIFHLKVRKDVKIGRDSFVGEVHFNRVPSRSFFPLYKGKGLGTILHGIIDGDHSQNKFLNRYTLGLWRHLTKPVYGYRNMAVNIFEQYHNNRLGYAIY